MNTTINPQAPGLVASASASTQSAAYPVRVHPRLDQSLSRWLWLVKPVLLVPHLVVLAVLWAAAIVVTAVVWPFALITGRYPMTLFGFTVGVLRWTWQVAHYGLGAFGTDAYPRFSLASNAGDAADFDVPYPARVSRVLVLFRWILAVPHYLVVAVLLGGVTLAGWQIGGWQTFGWNVAGLRLTTWNGGLIAVLALSTGVVLAGTGRYPPALHDVIVGLDRWVLRVAAYSLMLTDAYPPFRVDLSDEAIARARGAELSAGPQGGGAWALVRTHALGTFFGLAFGLAWGVGWLTRGEPTGACPPCFLAGLRSRLWW